MNKHDTAMSLIMWTTFDQYFSLDSGPRILLWLLEPSDWMVTLAYYDPELIYFEYQPIDQLEVLYALT